VEQLLDGFLTKFRRREIVGSFSCAMEVAELLKQVVSKQHFKDPEDVLRQLRCVGQRITAAVPIELAAGNITRRVLYFVREEIATGEKTSAETQAPPDLVRSPSLENYLLGDNTPRRGYSGFSKDMKQAIIQQIKELIDEIHAISTNIAEQSLEHIHANEVILSHGISRTVVNFLRFAAGKGRKFEVVVADTAPRYSGHELAHELAGFGIQVTVIPDAAIFGVMSRVNKVIIGTHAVLANGGLCAPSGLHLVALAAKHHSVPVVVCTGLYKLCPLFPHDQDTFNQLRSPEEVVSADQMDVHDHNVRVINPEFDYVPPELVSLFITNLGGHNPSYIYRLLAELYCPDDYQLLGDDDESGDAEARKITTVPEMVRITSHQMPPR